MSYPPPSPNARNLPEPPTPATLTGHDPAEDPAETPAASSAAPHRSLPPALVRQGSRLLHAQCWALGRDILHPDGNLLLRHGFLRLRPPAGTTGCSQYTLPLTAGKILRVWGFGVYIGSSEGLYLNRFEFVPRAAVRSDTWSPAPFARGPRHVDAPLLDLLTQTLASYESWIEATCGKPYRTRILESMASGEPVHDLPGGWHALRAQLAPQLAPIPTGPQLPAPSGPKVVRAQRTSAKLPANSSVAAAI